MNILGTYFKVTDNSGAKKVLCIGVLNKKNNLIKLGNILIVVIKSVKSNSKLKISTITKALIVRTKLTYKDFDSLNFTFNDNAVILLDINNNLLGTRIFGNIIFKNLFKLKFIGNNII